LTRERRLFGTAGIRGRYLSRVTPELAYRLGLAVAYYVGGSGTATVGHDVRTTSPLLAQLAAAGLMAGGVDAIYIGTVPTPVVAYSVPATHGRAGIIVTASHNPPPDNGLKVVDSNGMEYTESMERDLEGLILDDSAGLRMHASWDRVGRLVMGYEIQSRYIRDMAERLEPQRHARTPKIAVDCANGAASLVTPHILRRLGVDVVSINCHPDGTFPGRTPEPRNDVLEPYARSVEILGVEALMAHDGDADRLAIVLPGYGFVKQDLLIALFAKEKLRDRTGTVIVSVDVGLEVEEVVENMGGRLVRSKLGKIHERLRDAPGAVLAAEPWKLIDPEWGLWVDGIYEAALISKITIESRKSLREMLRELPFYPSARISILVPDDDSKRKLYEAVRERMIDTYTRYEPSTIFELDGTRIEWGDGNWVLVRMSGTETKLRLYMQSRDRGILDSVLAETRRIVATEASRLNVSLIGFEDQVSVEKP